MDKLTFEYILVGTIAASLGIITGMVLISMGVGQ